MSAAGCCRLTVVKRVREGATLRTPKHLGYWSFAPPPAAMKVSKEEDAATTWTHNEHDDDDYDL